LIVLLCCAEDQETYSDREGRDNRVCDKTFEKSLFHPAAISTMTTSGKPTAITDKGKTKN